MDCKQNPGPPDQRRPFVCRRFLPLDDRRKPAGLESGGDILLRYCCKLECFSLRANAGKAFQESGGRRFQRFGNRDRAARNLRLLPGFPAAGKYADCQEGEKYSPPEFSNLGFHGDIRPIPQLVTEYRARSSDNANDR
jgi:hypothetical protein